MKKCHFFGVRKVKLRPIIVVILLVYMNLWPVKARGQILSPSGIRLQKITYLTSNLDSLTRSFTKRGYHIKNGIREPGGIFNNTIVFPNGCEIVLETTLSSDINDWRLQALKRYKDHISGIAFEVDSLIQFKDSLRSHNISITSFSNGFALDSCAPLDIVFIPKDTSGRSDTLSHHPNHVFRFDWVLLSAGSDVEKKLRKVFDIMNVRKLHEGCCDFWRLGPSNDFCFFRFEPASSESKREKRLDLRRIGEYLFCVLIHYKMPRVAAKSREICAFRKTC